MTIESNLRPQAKLSIQTRNLVIHRHCNYIYMILMHERFRNFNAIALTNIFFFKLNLSSRCFPEFNALDHRTWCVALLNVDPQNGKIKTQTSFWFAPCPNWIKTDNNQTHSIEARGAIGKKIAKWLWLPPRKLNGHYRPWRTKEFELIFVSSWAFVLLWLFFWTRGKIQRFNSSRRGVT